MRGITYRHPGAESWENLWVRAAAIRRDEVHGSTARSSAAFCVQGGGDAQRVQSISTGQPACYLDTQALFETLRER